MVFGTVVRTFVCALFGAVFGYILGVMLDLFPGFNAALLNGLHAVTGMTFVSMPALLATLGLFAGVILGVVISIMIHYAWKGKYAKYLHYWTRGYYHKHWHGYSHGRKYRHYYGGDCGPWNDPVEDSLEEIDGYVSYLEDMPKEKLEASDEKIERLSRRLSDLRASLGKNRISYGKKQKGGQKQYGATRIREQRHIRGRSHGALPQRRCVWHTDDRRAGRYQGRGVPARDRLHHRLTGLPLRDQENKRVISW